MTLDEKREKLEQLRSILVNMNIPSNRYKDIGWLDKNIIKKNKGHKDFVDAILLIKELLRA